MVKKRLYLLVLLFIFCISFSFADYISNGGFEDGNLNGWTVSYGIIRNGTAVNIVTPGFAINSNNRLNMVHSGNYAAQLYSGYGSLNHQNWARIERNETVPIGYTNLVMWFAAVLCGVHYIRNDGYNSDSYVLLEILNAGNPIHTQRFSFYDNYDALLPGDMSYPSIPWKYLPWTKIIIPLAPYEGQTLTIRYTAYNCQFSAHDCYGYIDDFDFEKPPSPTPTYTETFTITPTYTDTPTFTITPTASTTFTTTNTSTFTPTPTFTPTFTCTPTVTPTIIPANLTLIGPYPNPAEYYSNIVYHLSRFADITIKVFTVSGELVRQAKMKGNTGYNNWEWNLKNNSDKKVASGIYIIHIIMEDIIYKRKEDAWCKASVVR